MISIYATFEQPARILVEALLNGSWHGMLVTLGVAAMLWALPRTGAATRYVIWCVTLLAVALLPLVVSVSDRTFSTSVASPPASLAPPAAVQRGAQAQQAHNANTVVPVGTASGDARQILRVETASGAWWSLAAGIWLFIVLARLCRIAWGVRALRRLKRTSHPLPSHYQTSLGMWLRGLPARRTAEVRVSDSIVTPMTVGFVHPAILLPGQLLTELSTEELAQVTLHELAHVRRFDDWTNLAQRVIESLLFFHPAVYWIARRMDLERELACDNHVVAMVTGERSYALCLTRLAELAGTTRPRSLAPGIAPTGSHLAVRVHALLSSGQRSTQISAMACMAAITLVILSGGMLTHAAPMIALSKAAPPPVSTTVPMPLASGHAALDQVDQRESKTPHQKAADTPVALPATQTRLATIIPESVGTANSTRADDRAKESESRPASRAVARASSESLLLDDFKSPVPQVAVVLPQVVSSRGCTPESSTASEETCGPGVQRIVRSPNVTSQTQSADRAERGKPDASRTVGRTAGVDLTITLTLPDHASVDHPGAGVAGLSAFASAANPQGSRWQPNVGNRLVPDGGVPMRGRGIRLRVIGGGEGRGSLARTLNRW